MASIIQEGQMSAPLQGGLFEGKNFWLSARVPSRSNYIQQIKVNGGNVVLTEKDADILIVDHLRDHSADTAFSYRFIEKSIQNKKLEDLDDHLVVPTQKKKAKASGLKSRSNFTPEDDDILFAKLASVDSGHNGNKIYHELHEKYPHHTMHSWRGRWVDHFSKIKDSKLKLEKLKEKMGQELEEDLTQSDEESEPAPARNSMGKFTKDDEAMLRKVAVGVLKDRGGEIYKSLSKESPNHTPEELEAYFINVLLPRISLSSIASSSNEPTSKPKDRHNSEDKGKPIDLTEKAGQEGEETTSGSLGPKRKNLQPSVNTKSPLRTMSVRESPRSWSKEGNKQLADLQPHRSTANSSIGKIKPARNGDRKAIGETITTEILQSPSHQAQGGQDEIQTKDKDSEIAPLSDKLQFSIVQNSQKRKREKIILTPEQKKRKRNLDDVIESTPEAESTTQSRKLSPELGDSSQKSSPPVVKDRKGKKYGEMSTQALYDQLDEGELLADLEFPELELEPPSSPSSPLAPLLPEKNSTPSSKLLPKSPAPAWASSPNSPDSARVLNLSAFLDYCQKKFMTSEKKVVDAIERTSGNRLLVEVILGCDAIGEALPDYPGIWTTEQDKVLLGADSKVIKELAETKGEEQMVRRMEFLNMWNRA